MRLQLQMQGPLVHLFEDIGMEESDEEYHDSAVFLKVRGGWGTRSLQQAARANARVLLRVA